MTDTELIQKTVAKEHGAFKKLVDRYQALVLNTCYGLIGNRQDAEDSPTPPFPRLSTNQGEEKR